jgi:hypothetical protein
MTPRLPQPVLERIFLLYLRELPLKYEDKAFTVEDLLATYESKRNSLSWSLVSRAWGKAFLAVKYAGTQFIFWRDEEQVGDVCMPIAVPYIVSHSMIETETAWLSDGLFHFAHRLVLLDLTFVDFDRDGIRKLGNCVNLERLGLTCDEKHRGDLHEVLDVLRFLPYLAHIYLERFDGPFPHTNLIPTSTYTPPVHLTDLTLVDIAGADMHALLIKAFDPSQLLDLTTLEIFGFGDAATFSLISAFQSTLTTLAYELDINNDSWGKRFERLGLLDESAEPLLPICAFPALKEVRLNFKADELMAIEVPVALGRRVDSFLNKRDSKPLPLGTLTIVDIPYTEEQMRGARVFVQGLKPKEQPSQQRQHMSVAAEAVSKAFEIDREKGWIGCLSDSVVRLAPFPEEVVLEKGREVRRLFGEEE